ncbi:MAG TPA: UvrD-helicase domain-containing protein, partial [Lentzea sp.]
MALPPQLVRRKPETRPRPRWDAAAQRVFGSPGFLRVLGGPGTGKTTLLAELAAHVVLEEGASPENVLVLTANRRASVALRAHITRLLTGRLSTIREPLVRTVHSYAFAVLRNQAVLQGEPPPRLLSGPDQDAMVRELLAGDVDLGASNWPERLRPALELPGFAHELRDLLLRAAERGLGPEDLIELGEEHGRDEWVAAGVFGRQYESVNLLSGMDSATAFAPAYDAAELVSSAYAAFVNDEELLFAERRRVRYLLVDDAQHLDPMQYSLIRSLGSGAARFVLAGDPDQAIFTFRGASPEILRDVPGETVVLSQSHRMMPEIRDAVARLASRLPGASPAR